MKLVQLSDTHTLSSGVTTENTRLIVDFINDVLRPDLVVHTGDIVGLSPDDAADRRTAAQVHARLRAPMLAVPGNHDVGSPLEHPWMGWGVTTQRLATHHEVFGPVPFLERFGPWDILGLNSQLFGSGLPEEEEQWEWVARALRASSSRPTLAFMHRPLSNHRPSREADGNSVPASARRRLLSLFEPGCLRALGTGHLHWYRRLQHAELLEVWGPATGFVGPVYEDTPAFTQCGVVEWLLDGERIETRFRAPTTLDEREFLDIPEVAARIAVLERERAA